AIHLVEVLERARQVLRFGVALLARLLDEAFPRHEVAAGMKEHALRLEPVAAGPSRLLLVVLDRLRQCRVADEADVRAFDAQAERGRGDDDVALLGGDLLLEAAALVRGHARGIRQGVEAALLEREGQPFRVEPGNAVDNARLVAMSLEDL